MLERPKCRQTCESLGFQSRLFENSFYLEYDPVPLDNRFPTFRNDTGVSVFKGPKIRRLGHDAGIPCFPTAAARGTVCLNNISS